MVPSVRGNLSLLFNLYLSCYHLDLNAKKYMAEKGNHSHGFPTGGLKMWVPWNWKVLLSYFHSTDWVSSTMKICFLTVLETRSLRLQCHHGQFLLRSGWQVSIFFAVCSHNRERKKKRGGSLVSLPIRTLILSD